MKHFNKNLVKTVTKRIAELNDSTKYSIPQQVQIVMYAVAYNANHAAYKFGCAPSTVYTLLRAIGLEHTINSYNYKPNKAVKAKLKSVA